MQELIDADQIIYGDDESQIIQIKEYLDDYEGKLSSVINLDSRMVNLTLLAPDIVHAILEDTLPEHITLFDLAVDPPLLWDEQRARLERPATAVPAE